MATLEDRLLGEKLHYYCSSSEDEADNDEDSKSADDGEESGKPKGVQESSVQSGSYELREWEGTSSNTGPKGVLKDWRNFKQMESEKRKEKEREKVQLAKKLTLTCRSHIDDEKEKAAKKKAEEQDDVDAMLDAAVLESYIAQRMQEMMLQAASNRGPQFGTVVQLKNCDEFLNAIDNENKNVTVIIHLYRKGAPGCDAASGCLNCLATEYPHVKFCELKAATAGLSNKFINMGVPAILVYKEGNLLANFVRLSDTLGEDFYASDLETFLVEHGMLPDKSLIPVSCIRAGQDDDSDDSSED